MKRHARLLLFALAAFVPSFGTGCDGTPEAEVEEIEEITLVFENDISDGYVFESGTFTTRALGAVPRDPLPDLLVVVYRTQENDALEVAIGTDYAEPRFRPMGDFGGPDEGVRAFLDLEEAPPFDLNFFNVAVVEEGQVWVVRTLDDRYAKIVILETERRRVGNRNEGRVRLGWAYPIPQARP